MPFPSLFALASPLAKTVSTASGAIVRGAEGAFQHLFSAGDEIETPASASAGDDLPARAEALESQFQEAARATLSAAGIELDSPLVLESDALGYLRVADGRADAAKIEQALTSDPDLASLFDALQKVRRELNDVQEAERLDRLFRLDASAAWQQMDDPSEGEAPFRVTISPAKDQPT